MRRVDVLVFVVASALGTPAFTFGQWVLLHRESHSRGVTPSGGALQSSKSALSRYLIPFVATCQPAS
jgi:hypothetical protein